MGVLVLFPLGIDAARKSVESTRAATIARMAKAALTVGTPNSVDIADDGRTPFQRILETPGDPADPDFEFVWHGPYYYEEFYPDLSTLASRPQVWPADVPAGQDPRDPSDDTQMVSSEYSWSMVVAYPSAAPTNYDWGALAQATNLYVVQIAVYRNFSTGDGTADITHGSVAFSNVGAAEQTRSGDHVRHLNALDYSGDGFWYRVDELGTIGSGPVIKLNQRYRGYLLDPPAPPQSIQFSDRVIGVYTFLMSAY